VNLDEKPRCQLQNICSTTALNLINSLTQPAVNTGAESASVATGFGAPAKIHFTSLQLEKIKANQAGPSFIHLATRRRRHFFLRSALKRELFVRAEVRAGIVNKVWTSLSSF
jgi:hypothetical protein